MFPPGGLGNQSPGMARRGLLPQRRSDSTGSSLSNSNPEYFAVHGQPTRTENMESMQAEPKDEKVGDEGVDGGRGGVACELWGRDRCQTHREHPGWLPRSKDQPQSTYPLDCWGGRGVGGGGGHIIVSSYILSWGRGTHGNASMWMTFPQLSISAAA